MPHRNPVSLALRFFALCSAWMLCSVQRPALGRDAMDFELSDGRSFIRLSALPEKVTLVNFWRADCPPCLKELPALARLARSGRARVILVAIHKPSEIETMPDSLRAHLRPPAILLYAPSQPQGLLSRFGDVSGALPHSVWLDGRRETCATRTGMIDDAWLEAKSRDCANT